MDLSGLQFPEKLFKFSIVSLRLPRRSFQIDRRPIVAEHVIEIIHEHLLANILRATYNQTASPRTREPIGKLLQEGEGHSRSVGLGPAGRNSGPFRHELS